MTILVLVVVCVSLAWVVDKNQTALANMHPMIVRINDVVMRKRSTTGTFSIAPSGRTSIT